MFHCVTLLLDTTFPISEDGGCPMPLQLPEGRPLTWASYLPAWRGRETWGDQRSGPEVSLHGQLRGPREVALYPSLWITQKTYSHSILISPASRTGWCLEGSLPVASDGHQGSLQALSQPQRGWDTGLGPQKWACSHGAFISTKPAQHLPLTEWVTSRCDGISHLLVIRPHRAPLTSHNQISLIAFSYSRAVDNYQY